MCIRDRPDPLHHLCHLPRRRLAQAELRLVLRHRLGSRLANLLIQMRILQPHPRNPRIHRVQTDLVHRQIGRRVVAHHDHQRQNVLQRQRLRRIQKEQQSRAAYCISRLQRNLVVPRCV